MSTNSDYNELKRLLNKAAREGEYMLYEMIEAIISKDADKEADAIQALGEVLASSLTLMDLYARFKVIREAKLRGYEPPPPIVKVLPQKKKYVPTVVFEEAIRDLLKREPVLVNGAQAIAHQYSTKMAFGMAWSSSVETTQRVQEVIAKIMRHPEYNEIPKAREIIAEMGEWPGWYAENVFRTNAATAYMAGRFAQVQDADVAEVIKGFRFSAIMDADVRPNHAAAHGLIAGTTDPIWEKFCPPLGYNCRCDLVMMDVYDLKRMNLITDDGRVLSYKPPTFGNAHPDRNFGMGRADKRFYATPI